ncbi:metallophosphoesterase [Corynebacterium heidelbergense]|nr:metallophosphoesterase [Corynebacterium heidelbergense]
MSSASGIVVGNEGHNAHGRFLASDLQICTVTENSATVSWVTWDADISPGAAPVGMETTGRLEIWPSNKPGEMKTVDSPADSAFHVLTIDGLRPDTDYSFRATSHGTPATYRPATVLAQFGAQRIVHPGEGYCFRTIAKLNGTYLGTIVVANDLHLGETADGNIIAGFPPAAVSAPGAEPYPTVMTKAVIDAATRAGASHLFINGDITSENRPAEVELAERLFKAFPGALRTTRGNHDRPHKFSSGAEYAAAPLLSGQNPPGEYSDAFGTAFEPRQKMWVEHIPYGDLRIIGIDSTHMDAAGGTIEPQQFTDIEKELAFRPDQPTIILLHHPMTRDAAWSNVGGPAFILDDADMLRLQRLYRRSPWCLPRFQRPYPPRPQKHARPAHPGDVPGNPLRQELANRSHTPADTHRRDLREFPTCNGRRRIRVGPPNAVDLLRPGTVARPWAGRGPQPCGAVVGRM